MNHLLIIAVHPDDEVLGCGGTILKHKKNGDIVSWVIVTNCSTNYGFPDEIVKRRQDEIDKVAKLCDFDNVIKLDFPTTKLDEIPFSTLVNAFSKTFNELKPTIVILPNRSDVHSDHRYSFDAAYSCTKNFRYPFIKEIWMCETMSETEFAPALNENVFIPNIFIDITPYMEQKLNIMSVYESEVMPNNLPRSLSAIKSLAGYRGSRIGIEYAEAFMLLLKIE